MLGILFGIIKAIIDIALFVVLAFIAGVAVSIWFASILRSDDCSHCSCRDNCIVGKGVEAKCDEGDLKPFACGIEYDKM